MKRRLRSAFGLAGMVLSLLGQTGCGDVLDIPGHPQVVAVAGGPWSCLGQSSAPPAVTSGALAQVRVQACNFISDCKTTVTGLNARLCDKRDVGCISPRLSNITDSNGELRFTVPTTGGGFDGYLLVTSRVAACTDGTAFGAVAGKAFCDLVSPGCNLDAGDATCSTAVYGSAMMFFNPPITQDVTVPLPLQMFPTAGLPAVIAAAGIEIDPAAGNLFIQALDCDGKPATGVSFKLNQPADKVSTLYVTNGIVSSTATRTDSAGIGGFVRVPPGFVSVTGYNSDAAPIGEIGVQAAASMLTYSTLLPSRAP